MRLNLSVSEKKIFLLLWSIFKVTHDNKENTRTHVIWNKSIKPIFVSSTYKKNVHKNFIIMNESFRNEHGEKLLVTKFSKYLYAV